MADKLVISRQLTDALGQIEHSANTALDDALRITASNAVQSLRNKNVGATGNRWKKYPKGWTVKKEGKKNVKYIVWNSKHPGLTHLLEKGHRVVTKNGVDTGKRTEPQPHIAEVDEKLAEWFEENYERKLKERLKE